MWNINKEGMKLTVLDKHSLQPQLVLLKFHTSNSVSELYTAYYLLLLLWWLSRLCPKAPAAFNTLIVNLLQPYERSAAIVQTPQSPNENQQTDLCSLLWLLAVVLWAHFPNPDSIMSPATSTRAQCIPAASTQLKYELPPSSRASQACPAILLELPSYVVKVANMGWIWRPLCD